MTRPQLHLCIATGQNLANLIPALQCGAREVWILQTPAMRASAQHLADALKPSGVTVRRVDFDDSDVTALHAQAGLIAEQLDGRAVVINMTGGTKLMTLALTQTLARDLATGDEAARPHLVYTDTVHGRLDWLEPKPASEPMTSVLRIDDVLRAQGYRRQPGSGGPEAAYRQRAAEERAELTRWLGAQASKLERAFGALNGLAQAARGPRGDTFSPLQQLAYAPGGSVTDMLTRVQSLGLATWDGDVTVQFRDAAAAEYLGGGWVEEYAALKIAGQRCDGGWEGRLEVEHVDSGARNELDAVAVHRNRFLLVECKAARTSDDKVADWIYKASQLARSIGGQLAQPLLLSARVPAPEHLQRAREYGVEVLAGAGLARLPEHLRGWMAR